MKYIKASLCSLVTFCCLSYIHSAEDLDPLFAELKKTKKEFHVRLHKFLSSRDEKS